MKGYGRAVRKILIEAGCRFLRQGRGDHEIWISPHAHKPFTRIICKAQRLHALRPFGSHNDSKSAKQRSPRPIAGLDRAEYSWCPGKAVCLRTPQSPGSSRISPVVPPAAVAWLRGLIVTPAGGPQTVPLQPSAHHYLGYVRAFELRGTIRGCMRRHLTDDYRPL